MDNSIEEKYNSNLKSLIERYQTAYNTMMDKNENFEAFKDKIEMACDNGIESVISKKKIDDLYCRILINSSVNLLKDKRFAKRIEDMRSESAEIINQSNNKSEKETQASNKRIEDMRNETAEIINQINKKSERETQASNKRIEDMRSETAEIVNKINKRSEAETQASDKRLEAMRAENEASNQRIEDLKIEVALKSQVFRAEIDASNKMLEAMERKNEVIL